jgi:hypothetical protein
LGTGENWAFGSIVLELCIASLKKFNLETGEKRKMAGWL